MALAVSSWGSDYDTMSWLDGDTNCTGNCTNAPELIITNISYDAGEVPPTNKYHFGQLCASTLEGDCGDNCQEGYCKWSWPVDDIARWNSKDATCRCQQTAPRMAANTQDL